MLLYALFTGLEVEVAMADYFCLPSDSSFYLTHKGFGADMHKWTHTDTQTHMAPTASLFVSNLGGFNKSHSSFQAPSLSGLLETASALREFKPNDSRSRRLPLFQ